MEHVRIHMSPKPVRLERRFRIQRNNDLFKPRGLWYSNHDEWYQFSRSWKNYGKNTAIYLVSHKANVLTIRNAVELDEFTKEYQSHKPIFPNQPGIDWIKVTERYDGIEIMDYLHECRMDNRYFWYYPWDVSSGCIWNPKTVQLKRITWWEMRSSFLLANSAHQETPRIDILE